MVVRVYLAGPDVFLPQPQDRAAMLQAICQRHGLHGISPLDPLPGEPKSWATLPEARCIARRNEAHIRRSDALVANLMPFRGPAADAGTAYEVGFARALGLPIFGWANWADNHADRVRALPGSTQATDAQGLAIEDFGLFENLMLSCGIEESGGTMITAASNAPWHDLEAFERCVVQAAAHLAAHTQAAGAARPPTA